ncbi:MAG: tetratricopeptide repeat protein [Pseudomonadota bacterium]
MATNMATNMAASSPAYIVDLTEANFAEVIGRSRQVPVLVDFWADWCAPCKQIGPVLEKLANEFRGAFVLAKVNADREPLITQQFGVRGLPTLKLVAQGQLAGELTGAHPEAAIRKLLAPHLGAQPEPGAGGNDDFHAQVLAAVDAGQVEDAIAALSAQLRDNKDDHASRVLLTEILLQENRREEARTLLAAAPENVPELRRARALLAFAERADTVPPLRELEAAMKAAPDTRVLYGYALRLVMIGRIEEGLDLLLQILRTDRQFEDDAARRTLIEIFDMLGRDDPLTAQYRRRMANALN